MHGPDGVDFQNKIVFLEVVKPKYLIYDHSSGDDADPGQFQVTVTFDNHGGKTLITMRALFVSKAELDKVVNEFGAIEGANQTLDRLEEELAKMGI